MVEGGGHVIVGTVWVTVMMTPCEVLALKFASEGKLAVSACIPTGSVCGAVVSAACADAELISTYAVALLLG